MALDQQLAVVGSGDLADTGAELLERQARERKPVHGRDGSAEIPPHHLSLLPTGRATVKGSSLPFGPNVGAYAASRGRSRHSPPTCSSGVSTSCSRGTASCPPVPDPAEPSGRRSSGLTRTPYRR